MDSLASAKKLLPRSKADFASKDYWDRFFSQRTAAFEWYGEYQQISPIIFKYARQNDKLLVLGCGNSMMSQDLYKSGYTSVVSIDISDVVIKQMKKKYPKLDFRKMDATKLDFDDGDLGNVVDKGTVDALLPDESPASVETAHKIFGEASRCLRFGGRFICVSLLQDHVARTLFGYFNDGGTQDTTWVVRVHRCMECESKGSSLILPVYIVVCTKMKRLPVGSCVLEMMLDDDKPLRYPTVGELCAVIKDQQNYAFMRNHINRTTLTEEYHTQLYSPEDGQQRPKYEMFIVDTPEAESSLKMACFLVPEGREAEWLFGSPEGRKITARQCSAFRVVFVHLSRHFRYGGQKEIQDELSAAVKQLVPRNFKHGSQIPFMSLGDTAGTRTTLEKGYSELSGEFVVEDVVVGHETYRRLVFCGRQSVIQTEMRIAADGQLDFSYLSSDYYKYMMIALGYFDEPGSALLLGLGGGSLASFVAKYTQWEIDAVEFDEAILDVAKRHFGLPDRVKTHVQNALEFVERSTHRFEIIWLDIDSKNVGQALTCPPEEFLAESFLANVVERLTGNGIFVVNLACRDEPKCLEVYGKLKTKFKYLSMVDICQDINRVLMASNLEQTACHFESVQQLLKKSHEDNEVDNLSNMVKGIEVNTTTSPTTSSR